ncbi:MAG: hypothetical protein KF836_11965 [Fimbriimonadaceae bacterium]|nr:hypothetical protein [Fimbriimonadaceae bacterium]
MNIKYTLFLCTAMLLLSACHRQKEPAPVKGEFITRVKAISNFKQTVNVDIFELEDYLAFVLQSRNPSQLSSWGGLYLIGKSGGEFICPKVSYSTLRSNFVLKGFPSCTSLDKQSSGIVSEAKWDGKRLELPLDDSVSITMEFDTEKDKHLVDELNSRFVK